MVFGELCLQANMLKRFPVGYLKPECDTRGSQNVTHGNAQSSTEVYYTQESLAWGFVTVMGPIRAGRVMISLCHY